MPPEVDVATNPLIVYGMVAVFGVAVVLALVFARPRRGLGAVKRSEVPDHLPGGRPWMPGGDIWGRDPQPEAEPAPAIDPWQPAGDATDPWQATPPTAPPAGATPAPVHGAWSTGTTGPAEPQPPWGKR
jgi:hypothetical protein